MAGRAKGGVTAALPALPALRRGPSREDRILGCLLGGAIGDALGAPVEFDSLADIRRRTGFDLVRQYLPAYGHLVAITDDTQMTLFTAEGLIVARRQGHQADDGVAVADLAGPVGGVLCAASCPRSS